MKVWDDWPINKQAVNWAEPNPTQNPQDSGPDAETSQLTVMNPTHTQIFVVLEMVMGMIRCFIMIKLKNLKWKMEFTTLF